MRDAQEARGVLLLGTDLKISALKPLNIESGHCHSWLKLADLRAFESTSIRKKADFIKNLPKEIILVLFSTCVSSFSCLSCPDIPLSLLSYLISVLQLHLNQLIQHGCSLTNIYSLAQSFFRIWTANLFCEFINSVVVKAVLGKLAIKFINFRYVRFVLSWLCRWSFSHFCLKELSLLTNFTN